MEKEIKIKIEKSEIKETSVFGGIQGEGGARTLKIGFDSEWDGLTKKITFFDAAMQNPVIIALTEDKKENGEYSVKIPSEPLKTGGKFTFIIDGTADGIRQRSVQRELRVKYAYSSKGTEEIEAITPTVAEQLTASVNSNIEKTTELSAEVEDNKTEIGTLKGRATAAEAAIALKADKTELSEIKSELESKKVDKAAGKGLSSNDYTDEEKSKLSGIEPNANNYVLPEDVVKFTDYATANKSGVVVADIVGGISVTDNGRLRIEQSADVSITYRSSKYYPITPKNLNFAVKSALSDENRISDMTDTEKENARWVIGASGKDELQKLKYSSIPNTTLSGYPVKITDGLAGESPLKLNVYGNSGKNMLKATDFYSALQKEAEKRGLDLYYSELEEDGRNCVRFVDCALAKYRILPFKENTRYTISMDCKTTTRIVSDSPAGSALFVFFYTDGTNQQAITLKKDTAWTHKTATSATGKTLSAIGLVSVNWRNWCYVDADTFQLEEGAAATDYEAFEGVGDLNSASGKYEISVSAADYEKSISGGTLTATLDRQLSPGEYIDLIGKKLVSAVDETDITVSGELEIPETETCYISASTQMSPKKIEAGYYQDINKVIKEINNSILSLGGNV